MYFLCIYVCIHSIIYLSLFFSSFFILLSFFSSYTPILFQVASHFCVYLFLLFLCISGLPPFGTYIDSDTRFWQFWTSFSSTFWHLLCPLTSLFHSLRVPVLHQFWHPFRTPPGPVQPSKCLSFSSFVFRGLLPFQSWPKPPPGRRDDRILQAQGLMERCGEPIWDGVSPKTVLCICPLYFGLCPFHLLSDSCLDLSILMFLEPRFDFSLLTILC